MKLIKIAESYLKQANIRLKYAKEALSEGFSAYALRQSQEAVELSLKAALKLVAIEYPKKHDVSSVLIDVKDRFPEWFREKIQDLAEVSRRLSAKRELSMYGDEDAMLPPDEAISRDEAFRAVTDAERVYGLCRRLLNEAKKLISK